MVAGAYRARSLNFDAQRVVNFYPEASGSGNSKSIAMLIGTPGTKVWYGSIGAVGPVRGMLRFSATIGIVVINNEILKIDNTGTVTTLLGTLPAATSRVSMASNGTTVMLVDGTATFYVIDPVAGTCVATIDPAYIGADVVYFIGGYFVFNRVGTQQYQIMRLYSTVIDPLDFASAEGAPDLLVSLIVDHNEIWLLGETTTEVHSNTGNVDFPFEPIQGAFIQQGCAAKFSAAKAANCIVWLTADEEGFGTVQKSVGYQPQRISDHALELAIQSYSRIDDAIGFTYQQEGHEFYMLTFPTAQKTWCYDFSTELWHERAWRNVTTGELEAHRAYCHMQFGGKTLVGDREDGVIFEFDLDTYADRSTGGYRETMPAIRQGPHLSAGDDWQNFWELWLDMETGVGLPADVAMNGGAIANVGADPVGLLEWSDDHGHTFPYSCTIKIGKLGEYKYRAIARRLGKSKDRIFRFTITDPVKRVILGAGCRTTVNQ